MNHTLDIEKLCKNTSCNNKSQNAAVTAYRVNKNIRQKSSETKSINHENHQNITENNLNEIN